MAIIVYDNNINGDNQRKTVDGIEITKKLIVDNIPNDLSGQLRTNYAIEYCGYVIGDTHDIDFDGEYPVLRSIDGKALSSEQVEVTLTYFLPYQAAQISISTNSYQVDTNVNYDGTLLEVSYKYPDNYMLDNKLRGEVISKSPTVTKEMNEVVMTITRTETTDYNAIATKAIMYNNTLNLAGWTVRPGDGQGIWMCTQVDGDDNGDGTYNMTYVFVARKVIPYGVGYLSGFSFDLFYRDERTGEPPSDVVPYTVLVGDEPDTLPGGIKQGQLLYPYAQFNNLITL